MSNKDCNPICHLVTRAYCILQRHSYLSRWRQSIPEKGNLVLELLCPGDEPQPSFFANQMPSVINQGSGAPQSYIWELMTERRKLWWIIRNDKQTEALRTTSAGLVTGPTPGWMNFRRFLRRSLDPHWT